MQEATSALTYNFNLSTNLRILMNESLRIYERRKMDTNERIITNLRKLKKEAVAGCRRQLRPKLTTLIFQLI